MNYGEELAYWYLRLNGFFPISNFVVHRSTRVKYTSDVDVLAVRPPHVYEEIGGQADDWDTYLSDNLLRFGCHIGLLCEVKTGAYEEAKLFRPEYLRYTIPRLGLVAPDDVDGVVEALRDSISVEVGDAKITKLFVSSTEHHNGPYLNRTLEQIENFLAERVRRYPIEKYADRMFFPSTTFQLIIGQVHRAIQQRQVA